MKVSFFQYQNGLNNGDVINGCGLFLIINFCNFVLRLLLPNDTHQVLQRHIKLQSGAKKLQSGAAFSDYKVGQNNYKVGQLKNYKVGQKHYKVKVKTFTLSTKKHQNNLFQLWFKPKAMETIKRVPMKLRKGEV